MDVSVSVRKCVCTCSQVDSCAGTFTHVYVSTGVHKCARRCSRVQVWMHAEVLTCVCVWSHTQCSRMCTSERAQACTSAPVGVCAHVCVCWPAPCTLSSPHVRREHTRTHSTLRTPGEPSCKHTRVRSHRCPSAERIRRHPPPGAPRGGVGSHVSAGGGVGGCAPPPH